MSIVWRRNYKLVILLVILIAGLLSAGSVRIIAYNFGQGQDINTISLTNYTNDTYIFDDTTVHQISIKMADGDYDKMIQTYKQTGDKEYFYADITIDGVTVKDVGIRLKGNLTLRQSLGGGQTDGQRQKDNNQDEQAADANNQRPMRGNFRIPEDMPEELATKLKNLQEDMANMMPGGGQMNQDNLPAGGMGGGMGGTRENSNPPFLIKFDKFVAGQTYQGYAEIAIRLGSDTSLLGEPVAFYLHEQAGQIVPETAYAQIDIPGGQESDLYVICEHIDEKYVAKHFSGVNSILYKAGNFTGFEYLGEDPSLYAEKFEQKTGINDDDLAPLIRFMKFVTESSDEEFAKNLSNWLDIDSFVRMMALDNLLSNNDSFVGMGSNYYLLYDKDTKQFTMLSWDMNLAMGGMGGGGQMKNDNDQADANTIQQRRQEIMQEWMQEGGFEMPAQDGEDNKADRGGGKMGSSKNLLKERFFANDTFATLYDQEYTRLQDLIYGQDLATNKVNQLASVFTSYNSQYNLLEQSSYDTGKDKLLSYITQQKNTQLSGRPSASITSGQSMFGNMPGLNQATTTKQ